MIAPQGFLILTIALALMTGCQSPGKTAADGFVAVGLDERGCVEYTRKADDSDKDVDAAIWYQREDGSMTTDPSDCATDKNKG